MKPSLTASITFLLLMLVAARPAQAQDAKVPYWASIRVKEVNMRVGPAEDYGIVWVYRRPLLPVKVLRVKDGWRLVEDPDGAKGWMLGRFLSRQRGAIVIGAGPADMRAQPGAQARLNWRVEPGVVGVLGACEAGWCLLDVAGRGGYVEQGRLWGPGEP